MHCPRGDSGNLRCIVVINWSSGEDIAMSFLEENGELFGSEETQFMYPMNEISFSGEKKKRKGNQIKYLQKSLFDI